MDPIEIGLPGPDTVGDDALRVLQRNQEEICRHAGRGIEVAMIIARNLGKAHAAVQKAGVTAPVVSSLFAIVDSPEIDIVVELTGGYDLTCKLVLCTIANGKHVVTASRALLAAHGNEIFKTVQDEGVMVTFKTAAAGGIPTIKALREDLTANHIEWIAGIINGTTDFILSEMRDKDLGFDTVLKEAQRLDYAEADPMFDIRSFDTAHRFILISATAFGAPIQFECAYVEGTTKLEAADVRYAEELGYRIKLLGITRHVKVGIELHTYPTLVPAKHLITNVEDAANAAVVNGDAVGPTLYCGKGAGVEPTVSTIVADLVDVTCLHTAGPEYHTPRLAFQPDAPSDTPVLPIDEVCSSYYLHMRVADETGMLADITRILTKGGIPIDTMLQKESHKGEPQTDIIMLSHVTVKRHVNAAIAAVEALPTMLSKAARIRMEEPN